MIATRSLILGFLTLLIVAFPSNAQQPVWRTDYNSARREATEKNRPLLVDFGTENCFWCKKLDMTTFRDPSVCQVVNGEFIPLRIDADREPTLVQKLQIHSYPTIVLASPDGRILTVIEGYVEAPKMLTALQGASAACLPTPEWMMRDFGEASKAVGLGDNARAIALFRTILEDGKNRAVQQRAREHLRVIEQQAENRLAHARTAQQKGQTLEAIETLTDLLRSYPGTPATVAAKGLLTSLNQKSDTSMAGGDRQAVELLAQARDEFKNERFFNCLEKCELLNATRPDSPEASEASKLIAEIKANPEWMARACNNLNERLTAMYLTLADSWVKKGKPEEATVCLEKVRQLAPGTHHAQIAVVKLAQIQGKNGLQAEFQKPK